MLTSLVTVDLLREKLLKQVGDQMPTSGEQARARHILSVGTSKTPLQRLISLRLRRRSALLRP